MYQAYALPVSDEYNENTEQVRAPTSPPPHACHPSLHLPLTSLPPACPRLPSQGLYDMDLIAEAIQMVQYNTRCPSPFLHIRVSEPPSPPHLFVFLTAQVSAFPLEWTNKRLSTLAQACLRWLLDTKGTDGFLIPPPRPLDEVTALLLRSDAFELLPCSDRSGDHLIVGEKGAEKKVPGVGDVGFARGGKRQNGGPNGGRGGRGGRGGGGARGFAAVSTLEAMQDEAEAEAQAERARLAAEEEGGH